MGSDTILYSYTVDPNGTPITTSTSTNIVTNPVLDAMITMVKSVDQTIVTLGDTITYTTLLTISVIQTLRILLSLILYQMVQRL
nr:hypothetical protein [Bacillus paranthracis]